MCRVPWYTDLQGPMVHRCAGVPCATPWHTDLQGSHREQHLGTPSRPAATHGSTDWRLNQQTLGPTLQRHWMLPGVVDVTVHWGGLSAVSGPARTQAGPGSTGGSATGLREVATLNMNNMNSHTHNNVKKVVFIRV